MLALAACAELPSTAPPPRLTLSPTTFSRLPGWPNDHLAAAVGALLRSCEKLRGRPDGERLGALPAAGTVGQWRPICAAAAALPAGDDRAARGFFERRFTPYLAADNGRPEGLFTGYFEAELRGSRQRRGGYRVPIYRKPDDLVGVDLGRFRRAWKGESLVGRVVGGRLVPYPTRAEIDDGALAGRGLELLWVDDPVDAFFLQVQGSGRVRMDDGSVVYLGYAGKNGHPYVSIGRELVAAGALPADRVSMHSIRAWLAAHPRQRRALLERNPSYVFFRELDGAGPIGAEGVALTAQHSLAVDPRFIPYGLPIWLDTTDPLDGRRPLRRLVVAQDTGGAIRGPVRGDLFWGFGTAAADRAGRMKGRGRYWLLLPRSAGS